MPHSENNSYIQKWISIAFINLLIVASLGVIMRYKIAYYLPFIEQKNFLHAHSHFAFSGWVTQVLMVLMWAFLFNYLPADSLKKYNLDTNTVMTAIIPNTYSVLWNVTGPGIF